MSRNCTAARWLIHRSTWRSWKPSGRPNPSRPSAPPVDLGQLGDAVDELEGQAPAGFEVGVEGCGPTASAHGGPAVDELHQIEAAPHEVGVVAHGQGPGVRDVGVGQRGQQPVLAEHGLVASGGDDTRRATQRQAVPTRGAISNSSFEAPPVMNVALTGSPAPGQTPLVEERPQAFGVDEARRCSPRRRPLVSSGVGIRPAASQLRGSLVGHLVLEVLGELGACRGELLGQVLGRPQPRGRPCNASGSGGRR